jgi:hypothetical protein
MTIIFDLSRVANRLPRTLAKFQSCVDVLEHCGGSLGNMSGLVNMVLEEKKIDPTIATKDEIAKALKEAQEQYLAVAFLCGSDHY